MPSYSTNATSRCQGFTYGVLIVMPPMPKDMGFTLSSLPPRPGLFRGLEYTGPVTTAPAAWCQARRPLDWPARTCCHSTTCSCMSYRVGTRWRKLLRRGQQRPAPRVSPTRDLKVVCSPENTLWNRLNRVKLIRTSTQVQPTQGLTTPCSLPARRRLNRYPSAV